LRRQYSELSLIYLRNLPARHAGAVTTRVQFRGYVRLGAAQRHSLFGPKMEAQNYGGVSKTAGRTWGTHHIEAGPPGDARCTVILRRVEGRRFQKVPPRRCWVECATLSFVLWLVPDHCCQWSVFSTLNANWAPLLSAKSETLHIGRTGRAAPWRLAGAENQLETGERSNARRNLSSVTVCSCTAGNSVSLPVNFGLGPALLCRRR